MTTTVNLLNLLEGGFADSITPHVSVYDKTGNLNFGTFYKVEDVPSWLYFVGVESFIASDNELLIRLKDFRGDVYTRNDDFSVFVLGFDYAKEAGQNGVYYPEYINVKATHYARCEEKVKKLKLTPESFGGYSFKVYGKKYTLNNVSSR